MHHSEQLWRAPEIGTLAYYYRPPPSEDDRDRVALGMPTDRAVYFCPHSMFRLTPAFDALLTRLLEEDGSAELWMVDARPEVTRLWQQRFTRVAGPKLQQRIRILPRQPHASYLALMHAADTVLDPIDFNGMNNSLDAFAAGVPVVTLPSGLQRGRHATGMYRAMQLTDCVADSEERYVEIAVRLGRDADFRHHVRKAVVERRDVLFEDDRVPRAFESFFRHACGR
jgi:predicted O-linked N-acetylglucosamine transferase (SPINDLY family)